MGTASPFDRKTRDQALGDATRGLKAIAEAYVYAERESTRKEALRIYRKKIEFFRKVGLPFPGAWDNPRAFFAGTR